MKTIYTTTVTLLFSISLLSQNYVAVNDTGIETNSYTNKRSEVLSKTESIHNLTLEIYNDLNFDYQDFLEDSENSKTRYRVGNQNYSKKELIKIFRKGARRSENVFEFEKFLEGINPEFVPDISERESDAIYYKFREGTLHAYLDGLSDSGVVLF